MTVQKCIDACAAAGYSSAGVEFGRECYCGNVNYPPGQSESMSECDMPCLGDASQLVHRFNKWEQVKLTPSAKQILWRKRSNSHLLQTCFSHESWRLKGYQQYQWSRSWICIEEPVNRIPIRLPA